MGQNPSEAELIEMISTVDDNGDNEIDFPEFLILMKSRIGEKDPEKELRDAFRVFDTDNSGSIDKKELKRLMKKLGQALSEAELDAMMDEVDTNGDGEISFEEFKELMVRAVEDCHFISIIAPNQMAKLTKFFPLALTEFLRWGCEQVGEVEGRLSFASESFSNNGCRLLQDGPFSCPVLCRYKFRWYLGFLL